MNRPRIRISVLTCLLFTALGSWASAQTDDGLFQQFQFNFSPPGARAAGMGRTFIGLANDGTAAISNPAGLVQLGNAEFYVEYRHTDLDIERLAEFDSLSTNRTTTFGNSLDYLSFLSFTKKLHDRVWASFTIHQFLNLEEDFTLEPRIIPDLGPGVVTFFPSQGTFDMDGRSYAGSIAVNVAQGFNVGLTVSADVLNSETRETRFDLDFPPSGPPVANSTAISRSVINDDDTAMSFTVGALYDVVDGFSLGAIYAKGARFDLQENFFDLTTPDRGPADVDGDGTPDFPVEMSINVPDRYGFGLQVAPTRLANIDSYRLTLAFDAVRIEYSDLLEDFTPIFSRAATNAANPLDENDFEIDDVWEAHLGGELGVPFAGRNTAFFRAGFFTNPDHRQRFVGSTGDPLNDAVFESVFQFPDDGTEYGWTTGGGLILNNRVRIDAAWVSIDSFQEIVASLAFAFP
ncbi:MAG TPA: hypothetical protein VLV83_10365 [Acidobacteriota bacterium]|nr:hypothetical protein [Acidobacteriota bacterium]